jgi:DnaJ-domain-containing protein 1
MANRPFISKRIDELEQMFKSSGTELLTLKALENELVHRSTPRAVSLLKAVRRSLSQPEFIGSGADPNLFDQQPISTKLADPAPLHRAEPVPRLTLKPLPSSQPVSETKWTVPPYRLLPLSFPAPAEPKPEVGAAIMSPEEACKVLQVTLGADWETIEKSRREIVQKSHPDKIRSLPPERCRALIEHARRANEAVQVVLGLRIQEKTYTSQLPEAIKPAQERVLRRIPQVNR